MFYRKLSCPTRKGLCAEEDHKHFYSDPFIARISLSLEIQIADVKRSLEEHISLTLRLTLLLFLKGTYDREVKSFDGKYK